MEEAVAATTASDTTELPIHSIKKFLQDENTFKSVYDDKKEARRRAALKHATVDDKPHVYELEKYVPVLATKTDPTQQELSTNLKSVANTESAVIHYITFKRERETKYYDNGRIKEIFFEFDSSRLFDLCEIVGLSIRLSKLHSDRFREMLSWDETKPNRRAEVLNAFITSHFQDMVVTIGGIVYGRYPIAYFSSISEPVLEDVAGELHIKFPIKLTDFICTFPRISLAFHMIRINLKYKETPVIDDVDLVIKDFIIGSSDLRKRILRADPTLGFETFTNINFKHLNGSVLNDKIVMPAVGYSLKRGFFYFGDYSSLSKVRFIGKTHKDSPTEESVITFTQDDLKKYAAPIGTMGNVLYIPFNLEKKFVPINKENPQVYLEGVVHPHSDEITVECEWSTPVREYGTAFINLNIMTIKNGMAADWWSVRSTSSYEYPDESNATISDVAAAGVGVGAGAEAR